jgi:hypothetical protein
MEKRLVTNNFSFRLFTTFFGMHVINCFMWHRYANNQLADFKVELDALTLALMRNPKLGRAAQAVLAAWRLSVTNWER